MKSKELLELQHQWRKAYKLAEEKFRGKNDKGGKPYFSHMMRVWTAIEEEKNQKVSDENSTLALYYEKAIIVAILHDIVEDTDVTLEYLTNEGFDKEIVNAIDAITRRKEEQYYFDFIKRIKKNDIAKLVKIYDLEDNMDSRRLKTFGDYEQKRLKKYWYCWKYLKGEIDSVTCNNTIHPDRLWR